MKIFQEITPLTSSDVFIILDSVNKGFDYPIHNHPEFELNLISGASGNRIVGDSSQEYQQQDLVLIGPYLFHKWDDLGPDQSIKSDCRVITIQFDMNLFKGSLFGKLPFMSIQNLLQNASRGIQFTGTTMIAAKKMIIRLIKLRGIESILEFLKLLDLLARSKSHQYLTSIGFESELLHANSTRLHAAYHFILRHFKNPLFRMREVSNHLCLSDSAFSHFFKKCTNRNFSEFLIETRLGNASKLLIDTDDPISDLAFSSGFNNMANFNRAFKKKYHCTPKIFRNKYQLKNSYDWTNQLTPGQFVPLS
jgi:AraC-like DNA-binding protein